MKIYRTSPDEHLHRVAREAAEWVQASKQPLSPEDHAALIAWLGASQLHLREALLANTVDKALAQPGALAGFDLDAVLARARQDANVVALHPDQPAIAPPHTARAAPRRRLRGTRRWAQAAALAAIIATGSLVFRQMQTDHPETKQYTSEIGERRVITLADGSLVTLAPHSQINAALGKTARNIELIAGEADFKVAHDHSRPFRVHAGDDIIQAVGTRFTVNRLPSGTVVAVSEGTVRMIAHPEEGLGTSLKAWLGTKGAAQPRKHPELTAGQAAKIIPGGGNVTPLPYDNSFAAAATARLTFHGNTLDDIATQFNRYNADQITIDDTVRERRYSGVFNAHDAESFLQFMECCTNLSVTRRAGQAHISARSDAAHRQ